MLGALTHINKCIKTNHTGHSEDVSEEDVYFSRRCYKGMFTDIYFKVLRVSIPDTHRKKSAHTQSNAINYNVFCEQHLDSHQVLGKKTGIKLGYAVTSALTFHWHLEQGEGISITQRVHYE